MCRTDGLDPVNHGPSHAATQYSYPLPLHCTLRPLKTRATHSRRIAWAIGDQTPQLYSHVETVFWKSAKTINLEYLHFSNNFQIKKSANSSPLLCIPYNRYGQLVNFKPWPALNARKWDPGFTFLTLNYVTSQIYLKKYLCVTLPRDFRKSTL